jgi:hypothetical protein
VQDKSVLAFLALDPNGIRVVDEAAREKLHELGHVRRSGS